jgi:hypothetical protein
MMTPGNGHDRAEARAALTRRLMQLAPRDRLEALIAANDARALVRSVPAEDLFLAIQEVGLADATEIVQLASPDQFRTFVDLGAWVQDALDPHLLLTWIRAARGDESENVMRKLAFLDLEVLELMLREFCVVHDLEENPDVNPEGITLETPEGRYLIELTVEGVEAAALRTLLNDLIAQNPFEAVRLLEAVRWELVSELEEVALQFRKARLEDLGFPPLEEAVQLFARVDLRRFPAPASGSEALAASPGRLNFVEAAFAGLQPDERETLSSEVRYLVNAGLVADAAEPGDGDAIRRVSEGMRDGLNLGLEHLCGGDPSKASEAVREHKLKTVFQVGFTLTLELKHRVDRLAKQPMAKVKGRWLLFEDTAPTVKALARRKPLRALPVEGAEPVAFRSRRELADAEKIVERAEAQREVLAALLKSEESIARFGPLAGPPSFEQIFGSALAQAALTGELKLEPVAIAQLEELKAALPSEKAVEAAAALGAAGRALAVQALEEIKAELDAATELDPRALTTLAIV